jgi:hypothetical protein
MVVESDGGDGIFVEGAVGDGLDEGSFACVLQSDYCDFEFLVEKLALDPIENLIEKSEHSTNCYKVVRLQNS